MSPAYDGACILLTTQHMKSTAIAPAFWQRLRAGVVEYGVDTDRLGTFSGEIVRPGGALEAARRKCEWPLQILGEKVNFALASEGSFGPHPLIPFIPCDHEILYFIDRLHGFHMHVSVVSEQTNYRTELVDSWDELQKLATETLFPSHALILRPEGRDVCAPIFKGLDTESALRHAYRECVKLSSGAKVWVETDMRAHCNPTRMKVISELADKLAARLVSHCPHCNTPGWGNVGIQKGLECNACAMPTQMIKCEVYGCTKCDHTEVTPRADGMTKADPQHCSYCNP